MFDFITDRINDKLRDSYYKSLGKPTPIAYPTNEIIDRILHSKKNHYILFKVSKILDKLDNYFKWYIVDKINAPYLYYKNAYVRQSHVLKSGLKKGEWYDEGTVMFHALFNTIKIFLKDDYGFEYYQSLVNTANVEELDKYQDNQIELYETCKEVTSWYDEVFTEYEKRIDACYEKLVHSEVTDPDIKMWSRFNEPEHIKQQNGVIFEEIREIEAKMQKEKIEMMIKIVKIHDGLWI